MRSLSATHSHTGCYQIVEEDGLKLKDLVEFFEDYLEWDGSKAVDLLARTATSNAMWIVTPDWPVSSTITAFPRTEARTPLIST